MHWILDKSDDGGSVTVRDKQVGNVFIRRGLKRVCHAGAPRRRMSDAPLRKDCGPNEAKDFSLSIDTSCL